MSLYLRNPMDFKGQLPAHLPDRLFQMPGPGFTGLFSVSEHIRPPSGHQGTRRLSSQCVRGTGTTSTHHGTHPAECLGYTVKKVR